MLGKNLLEGHIGPKTQSIDGVKALLSWKGRGLDPLPSFLEVLSNKKDCFYTVMARACSCPNQTYRGGRCKHMRKFFPHEQAVSATVDSIKPTGKWPGGMNGPITEVLDVA